MSHQTAPKCLRFVLSCSIQIQIFLEEFVHLASGELNSSFRSGWLESDTLSSLLIITISPAICVSRHQATDHSQQPFRFLPIINIEIHNLLSTINPNKQFANAVYLKF